MGIKTIGNRISILSENNVFSIVVLPFDKKWKVIMMFFWLLAWSVSGVLVFANYFTVTDKDAKLMLMVWLAFWAYFEFKIGKAYMFRRFGKEKLWIKGETLFYQREIKGRGKISEFNKELINEMKLIETKDTNFFQFFNNSFWVIGGETISFSYASKVIRLGVQLEPQDAKKLLEQIRKQL